MYVCIYKESYFIITATIIYMILNYTNNEEGYSGMHDNQHNKNPM